MGAQHLGSRVPLETGGLSSSFAVAHRWLGALRLSCCPIVVAEPVVETAGAAFALAHHLGVET